MVTFLVVLLMVNASYGEYISQLIRFARVCNHVTDFNARNKCLTAKLLQKGYRYHKLRKTFSKFYRRHYELISKYNVGLKTLWCFSFAPELVCYSLPRDLHRRAAYSICESWFLIHQDVYRDLFVCS